MIIYLDLLFILNFIFDLLILLLVKIVNKRTTSKKRIIISSLCGEISILFLIFNFNYIFLFISKIILAIVLNIIAFKYNNIKYLLVNLSYFYMISIILGGFIYYLKINNINYLVIFLLAPIILLIYYIQSKNLKIKQNQYYNLSILFNNNHKINLTGYLDTGNTLIEPISKKPIIVIEKDILKNIVRVNNPLYVPVKVLNHKSLLKCIKIKCIEIEGNKIDKVMLGISEDNLNIEGASCLLNNKLIKEIL